MNIGKFSVENSLFVNLATVFLLIMGVVMIAAMNREAFPNISYDYVTVRTDYFGSPAEEIENLITIPIEEEVDEVDDIRELRSVSAENVSLIIAELDPDVKNKDRVVNDIQRAVDRVTDLPKDAEDPVVTEVETKKRPVFEIAVSGDLPESELQRQVKILEDRLLEIEGVASIKRSGWHEREIWVEVDPDKLAEYYLSTNDVVEALRAKNLNVPAGLLKEPAKDYLVRTLGEFETPGEAEHVIVRANDAGRRIRIRDVGRARWAYEEDDLMLKSFGTQAINLNVVKRESGDIIKIVDESRKTIDEFLKTADPRLRIQAVNDLSYYVKRRLKVLVNNGAIGLVLVVGSLLLMMGRSTALMTALGIPVAVAATFVLMGFFGFTINLLTMFGLIMVLGLVVDDAIIVSENIYRHGETGKAPEQAAIDGTSEVWKPVTTTVLTTVAAFAPLFFMSGIMGKFIFYIPCVVFMMLSASLLEALFILPSHLADFAKLVRHFRGRGPKAGKESHWFEWIKERYSKLLGWVLHHRYWFVVLTTAIFALALLIFFLFMSYHRFPRGLIEEFFIRAEAPVGTSLEETNKRVSALEQAVSALPEEELDAYVTEVGMIQEDPTDPHTNRGTHLAQVHVFLTPEQARKRKARLIISELREQLKDTPGFEKLYFSERRAGPPTGEPVTIELRGGEYPALESMAEEIKAFLRTRRGVFDVRDDYEFGKAEFRIIVDEGRAMRSGLTIERIAQTVRHAFDGGVATTIRKSDEEIDVKVRFPRSARQSRGVFDKILIPNDAGKLIPLNQIVRFEERPGVTAIRHLKRKRLISVLAQIDEEATSSVEENRAAGKFVDSIRGKYEGVTVRYGGEAEENRESFQDFARALPLALLLIFVILATQFRSIVQPLVVMLPIPLGFAGVIFAFFLHFNTPLSFMAVLGMIGLSGIVVNDSIVLVDFINAERAKGKDTARAVMDGARLRLRPVVLTTVTTVFGLGPVAYGIGGNDPFLKPMALAIAWGLFFATTLTLLVIPCFYSITDEWSVRIKSAADHVLERFRARSVV